jgi:hypothetical protein
MGVSARVVAALSVTLALAPGVSCKASESAGSGSPSGLPSIDDQLMHTPEGLPVLTAVPNGEWAMALVYDPSLKDPITDWGSCLELFRGCYHAAFLDAGRLDASDDDGGAPSIAGCVAALPVCAGGPQQGGDDCCPKQCLDDFQGMVASGATENDSANATVLQGNCIAGFADFVDAGDAAFTFDTDGGVSP